MFVSDKCPHSSAVVTPVKYEQDSKDLKKHVCKTRNILDGATDEERFSYFSSSLSVSNLRLLNYFLTSRDNSRPILGVR